MRSGRVPANDRPSVVARRARISHTLRVVDALRARAIERLIPPLVHRLNNAVAVFQGVFELGTRASERDRENAQRELGVLSTTLARLSLLARSPSTRVQVVALDQLGQSCTLLLRPLAQTWKVELDVRCQPGLSTRCDAGLESLVLLASFELLQALQGQTSGRRLRLSIAALGDRARLVLAGCGPLGLPRAATVLREYARERGFASALRTTAQGTALRLTLPLLFETTSAPGRARPVLRRVLLLQEPGQDRELVATVLREQGCEVREEGAVPREGSFELVLLDETLLVRDPGALGRLGAQVKYARLERLRSPVRPTELLELLAR